MRDKKTEISPNLWALWLGKYLTFFTLLMSLIDLLFADMLLNMVSW